MNFSLFVLHASSSACINRNSIDVQSLCKLGINVVYRIYFALQPPKRAIEESAVEEMPKKRQCSDRDEDKQT